MKLKLPQNRVGIDYESWSSLSRRARSVLKMGGGHPLSAAAENPTPARCGFQVMIARFADQKRPRMESAIPAVVGDGG